MSQCPSVPIPIASGSLSSASFYYQVLFYYCNYKYYFFIIVVVIISWVYTAMLHFNLYAVVMHVYI